MKLSGILVAMAVSGAVFAAGPAPVISAANAQDNPQQRMDRLERMLEARQQGQARILEQLGHLQREVSELRGITEDHAYQLDQILQRQRDLYQEIDRRVAEVQAMGAAQPTPTEQKFQSITPTTPARTKRMTEPFGWCLRSVTMNVLFRRSSRSLKATLIHLT